ncbi:hypothetical protein V8G54_006655, partial [Vigna mungo]
MLPYVLQSLDSHRFNQIITGTVCHPFHHNTFSIISRHHCKNHSHKVCYCISMQCLSTSINQSKRCLLITGRSISNPICSRSLNPSMSGICTSLKTMSNPFLFSLRSDNAT